MGPLESRQTSRAGQLRRTGRATAGDLFDASGRTVPDVGEKTQENPPVGSPMPDTDADLCWARGHRFLVGKPWCGIPVPPAGVNLRVVCTTCPVTMDLSAERLSIFFARETRLVEEVRCG